MKARIVHFVLAALGVAAFVLGYLEKVPKYAAIAGAALMLAADLKKVVAPIADKAIVGLFALLLLSHALYGCATTRAVGPVVKACEPTTDQEMALIEAAAKPSQAEAFAAIDALGFVLCVLQRGADEAISALTAPSGQTMLALTAESYSPVLDNLRAWRTAHP